MRKTAIFIALVFLLVLCATPALANGIPKLPHAFYGSVTVNGAAASDGTQISATVDIGNVVTNAQNPVTTVGGSYGINSPGLLVQGDIPNGATITFYVNGISTGTTAVFEAGGGPTQRNLTLTIPTPPGVGLPPPTYIETNLFGVASDFRISDEGELLETIEATSEDGMLTITISEGTIALDKDGNPLDSLEVTIDDTPPPPPEGAYIIGLAYNFAPDGATFDPPITLTWSYDPDALPEGVAEEDLVIAYYDEAAGEWVELDCEVDTENDTITGSVEHSGTFVIIGVVTPPPPPPAAFTLSSLDISPTEVAPSEKVKISISVGNTGGMEGSYTVVLKINGVKEADKSVTIAAGGTETVTFSVTRKEAGSYTVAVDGLSGSFTVVAPPMVAPPAPAAFSVTNLSIQPTGVVPGKEIMVSVSVANTGGTEGSYTVVLKINGVKEAEKTVSIAAGGSETVSFSVTKEEVGSYTVTVDGCVGGFTVIALVPVKPAINWPVVGGVIAAWVVLGLLVFFLIRRRRI